MHDLPFGVTLLETSSCVWPLDPCSLLWPFQMEAPLDRHQIFDRLELAANGSDEDIDLGEAALLFAAAEYQDLDLERELGLFDSLAKAGSKTVSGEDTALGAANALSRFLFEDMGFSGNQRDYYDPRNSFINDVLKRRVGIPISLSLIYMEVGRRLDVPMVGIGLPSHFLMQHEKEPDLFVDAFNGGVLLSREECISKFRELTHPDEPWRDGYLAPISKRDMLTRMLRNLKVAHLRRKDNQRALLATTMLICMRPDLAEERRDRGVVQSRLGQYEEAIKDLRGYLAQAPTSADAEAVRQLVDHLRSLL